MRFVDVDTAICRNPDWNYLSSKCVLTEEFMECHVDAINWNLVSARQVMSMEFMLKHRDRINWKMASANQYIPEWALAEHSDLISMAHYVVGQPLSECFMRERKDEFPWHDVSRYQVMSPAFIDEMSDYVDWTYLSQAPLTEDFIADNVSRLDPAHISVYQRLSKEFIMDHSDWLVPRLISDYQCDIPGGFPNPPASSWVGKDIDYKRSYIRHLRTYDMEGDYVIAYKACRLDGHSTYNFHYRYEVGGVYESTADHNSGQLNSFGLSACTFDSALDYYHHRIIRLKIHLDDIATIVPVVDHSREYMIRCRKHEVIE